MKKLIRLICVVSCLLVCLTGCGNNDNEIKYDASQLREYMEAQISYTGGINQDQANSKVLATEEGVLDSAAASWSKLKDECGDFISENSVSDFEISESTKELHVTEKLKFEKRSVSVTATFEMEDELLTMTSLSYDAEYSMAEKMEQAIMNTLMGMGTVFCVLIFISLIISFFKYIPRIREFFNKTKSAESTIEGTDAYTDAQESSNNFSEQSQEEDDLELTAVIASAIAASENATTDDFVVRSIRKR